MTDWLRVLGYTVLGFALLLGLSTLVWWRKTGHRLQDFRDKTITHIQDSQRGRRPLWRDPVEPRK
ncbi:MAG TPA: hypothetical protein VMS40_18505 [Vicinamibacterales bacterium]|nr:hypothetical protein [Vicinamibacterales bacterium]